MLKSLGPRIRALVATGAVLLSLGVAGVMSAAPAQAYPWDPHVHVWFNISACSGSAGQWAWYSSGDGEQGWVSWNSGYQGGFDLWGVSTSGNVTRISWGYTGHTCGTRYFNITRPWYSNTDALGWIG